MKILSNFFQKVAHTSVLATGLILTGCTSKTPALKETIIQSDYGLKRDNFIKTLRDLKQNHQFILLADTFHPSVEIQELMADKKVLMALKEMGIDLVVREITKDQNKEYDHPKIKSDPEKIRDAYREIQNYLNRTSENKLPVTGQPGRDVANLIGGTLEGMQLGLGWKPATGTFTDEFYAFALDIVGDDPSVNFLKSIKYLKDAGENPEVRTLAMTSQDLCSGKRTIEDLAGDVDTPYHQHNDTLRKRYNRATLMELLNGCKAGIKYYYPDERSSDTDDDILEYIEFVQGIVSFSSEEKEKRFQNYHAAHPVTMTPDFQKRLQKTLDRTNSDEANVVIARNIKDEAKNKPALIVMGADHALILKKLLGHEKTAIVVLFPEPAFKPLGQSFTESRLPDYSYNITNDEITPVAQGTPQQQQAFIQRTLD